MTERTEYAVLRFVDKNGYCHMINDCVKGSPLARYIKEHPQTEKDVFFRWLWQLSGLMLQYFKWGEGESYGYMNPYAIIVSEDMSFTLLDAKEEENEEIVGFMQKKNVRALFMRTERILSLKMNFEDDMYGLGKTIQFLAAKCDVTPKISRKEERMLKRAILKCLEDKRKEMKDLKEVHRELRQLEEYGEKKGNPAGRRKKLLVAVAAAVLVLAAFITAGNDAGHTGTLRTARAETGEIHEESIDAAKLNDGEKQSAAQTEVTQGESELIGAKLEMGLLYLTELGEQEKGRSCLEEIQEESKLAQVYLKINSFLQKQNSETYIGRELEQAILEGREELKKKQEDAHWEEKQNLYEMPFLQAYGLLNTEEAAENSIQICSELLENDKWKHKEQGIRQEIEIRNSLAGAYERVEELQRAAEEYETVKGLGEEKEGLEHIYLKLEDLYEKTEQKDKMWETLKEAVEQVPDSEQIWIHYLRRCCEDSEIERTACADYVKQAMQAAPQLTESEEFQKLQKEYEITIEGETICVGK